MLRFEYECWKCPKWHTTTARDAFWGWRQGYARPAVSIGKVRLAMPRPPRVLVANGGRLWLLELPSGNALLIGATPRLWVGEWTKAYYEFCDHKTDPAIRKVSRILKRAKDAN